MPNINVDIILKLPLYKKLLILGAVWFIVIGLYYYFLYTTKVNEKNVLISKLEALKSKVAEKQKIAGNLPKFKKEIEDLNSQLKLALDALPNEKEIANLLEKISDAAKTAKLDILTFKPGKEAPKEFYAEVSIDMKVEGNFSNIMLFFEKVSALPRIVNINMLNITSGKETKGDVALIAQFIATTFKFLPQAVQAKK